MKPAPLTPSDTVGLIAPGSAPEKPEDLSKGIDNLRASGLRVKSGRIPYDTRGYLSGTDEERLSEFHAQMQDSEVDALMCVRGGFGCLRLLQHLDYDLARANPKLLIGYSDITALQLALYKHARWTSLSGPMVAIDWADPDTESIQHFWEMAGGATPERWTGPLNQPLEPVNTGIAHGTLLGGNLSVIARLIGTPYMPDLTDAILFIEDIGEPPYRIDGMLAHLRNAGVFETIGGLMLGEFTNADEKAKPPTLSLREVLEDYTKSLSIPVVSNLIYGHIPQKSTLPIGVEAELRVTEQEANLTIHEAVCA